MALYDDFLAGRLGDEDRLLKLSLEGKLTGDEFLRATPAERQRYLTNNQFTQRLGNTDVAMAHALRSVTNGSQQTPLTQSQMVQALQGMDPAVAQGVASQFNGLVTAWNQSMADKDFGSRVVDAASDFANSDYFVPAVATALFGGVGALGGAAGAGAESASGGGTAAAGSSAGTGTGGGMWDWLESFTPGGGEYLDPTGLGASDMGLYGFEGGIGGVGGSGLSAAEMAALEAQAAGDIATGGILGGGGSGTATFGNHLSSLFNGGSSLSSFLSNAPGISGLTGGIKSLFGGGNASGGGTTAGGGILGTILGNPLEAAFNATPFLLALSEANRQAGDIDGILSRINGPGYTNSIVNPYDRDTGIGRTALLEDQAQRGIRGSSFGQQTLDNFNYTRDIGRGDLMSRATMAPINMELNAVNARNTNRNLLLGAGLNASGRLFEPQRDPFGLSSLLGR